MSLTCKRTNISRKLCLLGLVFFGIAAGALRTDAAWQLVWSDEFSGLQVDSSRWSFDIGNGDWGWGNNELEYYTSRPQNVFVTNGTIHFVAIKESYKGFNYTSGKLKTQGLFSKLYGRFEFKAKLPQGQGYWPALWMMPRDSAYGGWASSGEIDVMENKGGNSTAVGGTIHYGGPYPKNTYTGKTYNFPGGESVTNFHVYALEWTTNAIRWYVDDQLYQTQTAWWSASTTNTSIRNPYPAPFDRPFYIIMNLAVGGTYGGNPDASTVFPGEMEVDYVRVYDWVSEPAPPPVLKLKFPFDDPRGATTTPSDTNGGGANIQLQMMNSSGAAADYHGAGNSGVGGSGRALDFSINGLNQPGNPGPVAVAANSSLGFGIVSNFVVTFWMKQNALMPSGGNIGPRLFVLGPGNPSDTGVTNSIGLKFQTSKQLYFQIGAYTASANFAADLPQNQWLFIAATYDGSNLRLFQGTDSSSVALISSTAIATNINFGTSATLYMGNRQDRQRSFSGWMDDFRFYTGIGDQDFVENIRQLAVSPINPQLNFQLADKNLTLSWSTGHLQSSTDIAGPWQNIEGATSPYPVQLSAAHQFYRLIAP